MSRTRVTPAAAPVERPEDPWHLKYRPQRLQDVVGQDVAVKSLSAVLKKKDRPHAFLFTGPAGTGKTTLARIVMQEVGCAPANIIETDAATNNGIDAMRELTSTLRYQGFGASPNKGLIIDEAHAISKAAWQSLLKAVEEPPPHVYWVFCTTEEGKIPEAIVTRCHHYSLRAIRGDDIVDTLERVARAERADIPGRYIDMVAKASQGSLRQALVQLSMIAECESEAEVARLLETPLDNKEIIDLCRLLLERKLAWTKLTSTLKAIEGLQAESARIVIVNYLGACLMGAKSDSDAERLLNILYPFSKPFATSDKLAPLLLAFGDVLFS